MPPDVLATAGALLLQVPPVVASVKVVAAPEQTTVSVVVIVAGELVEVTDFVALHPFAV